MKSLSTKLYPKYGLEKINKRDGAHYIIPESVIPEPIPEELPEE
jgi:hypothetical protein